MSETTIPVPLEEQAGAPGPEVDPDLVRLIDLVERIGGETDSSP